MRPPRFLARAALGLTATIAFAVPAIARDIRTIDQVYTLDRARDVRIEIKVGQVRIEPSTDRRLRASVTVQCNHRGDACERRARRVEVIGGYEGDTFVLRTEGVSGLNCHGLCLDVLLQVPRDLKVALEMGVGEASVHDLEKDVRVDLGVGEVRVYMEDDHVGSVGMDVGIGDATLRRPGRRIGGRGWLSKTLHWSEGAGPNRVSVHIGVGEAQVALR